MGGFKLCKVILDTKGFVALTEHAENQKVDSRLGNFDFQ